MTKLRFAVLAMLGLVIGLGIGLLVSWVVAPTEYVDTTPASLRVDFKDEYRLLIASAYASNLDMVRARSRLATLNDADPINTLGEQAERMMAANAAPGDIQAVLDLSAQVKITPSPTPTNTPEPTATETSTATQAPSDTPSPSPAPTDTSTPTKASPTLTATFTATPTATLVPSATPTATLTPSATATLKLIATLAPRPTVTPSPTPSKPFVLVHQTNFCDPLQPGLLQVNLTNPDGKPAAGVEVDITWLGGSDTFFTGMKPELGVGYADFTMAASTEYALSLSDGGTRITNLATSECKDTQGSAFPGGIRLELKQP